MILEIPPGSVWNYNAFISLMKRYDIREYITIADRGFASYDMPKKRGIYLILAISRNFSIVDFHMNLDRRFIFRNRRINASMKDLGDKIQYMYENTSPEADEEINLIRKLVGEEINRNTYGGEK